MCRRLTGNDADAADATQETLIAVVRGLRGFDGRSRFGTWSYRIAVNASLDELRRRRRRPEPGLDEAVVAVPTGAGHRYSTDASDQRLDVDAALAQLPPDFRVAVVLRDLCGLDYAEIATILDIPPGTVRSRIARGRSLLCPVGGPGTRTGPPSVLGSGHDPCHTAPGPRRPERRPGRGSLGGRRPTTWVPASQCAAQLASLAAVARAVASPVVPRSAAVGRRRHRAGPGGLAPG